MTDSKKTIKENIAEIERITNIIENHCLCLQLEHTTGNEYVVYPADGFQPAKSDNKTKRLSLVDLAMYLEKLWVWSGVQTKEEKIEKVIQYRTKNNLFETF